MTHKEIVLMAIDKNNDVRDMDINRWIIWGIIQITIMTAQILDNVESMKHKAESEE